MIPSLLVYIGLVLVVTGAMFLIHPVRRLRISTRRRAGAMLAAGLAVTGIGETLPAPLHRATTRRSMLDEIAPEWQFHEVHRRHVDAPPEVAWRAMRDVTANEIRLFGLLTWIRRGGRKGPESVLDAPERLPLLDVALRSGFHLLAERPPQEIVFGTLVAAPRGGHNTITTPGDFIALTAPGYAKAAMNFRIEPDGSGSMIHTETRVFATDDASRRSFGRYWRVIYPGSALIRREWLRAIDKRATRSNPAP